MNKLYTTLLIACLAAGFTACNDDDCEDLHLGNLAHYPNVLKGTFPTESQVLELGETLEITPELLNPEGATYSWLVNGKEYSTEPTFSYKIDNPCRADLSCIIKNKYGKVEMSILNLYFSLLKLRFGVLKQRFRMFVSGSPLK